MISDGNKSGDDCDEDVDDDDGLLISSLIDKY